MPNYLRTENGVNIWDVDGQVVPDFQGILGPPPVVPEIDPNTGFDPLAGALALGEGRGGTSIADRQADNAYGGTGWRDPRFARQTQPSEVLDAGGMSLDPDAGGMTSGGFMSDPRTAEELETDAIAAERAAAIQASPSPGLPAEPPPLQTGLDPALFARQPAFHPGTAGRKAGWDPARKMSIMPEAQRQGLRAGQEEAQDQTRQWVESQIRANHATAEERNAEATRKYIESGRELDEARNEAAEIRQRHDAAMAPIRKAQQELDATKVDPNRRYKGERGGLQRIGDAVAIALGAFSQGFGRTGSNPGMAVVKMRIEQDIEEQEQERARKQGKVQGHINELDRLVKSGISPMHAKSLIKEHYLKHAAARTEYHLANTALGNLEPAAEKLRADALAAAAQEDLARESSINDQITSVYQTEIKARSGYYGLETDRQYDARLERMAKAMGVEKTALANQMAAFELQKKAAGGGAPPKPGSEEWAKARKEYSKELERTGVTGLEDVLEQLADVRHKHGEYPGIGGPAWLVPDGGTVEDTLLSQESQEARELKDSFIKAMVLEQLGTTATDAAVEREIRSARAHLATEDNFHRAVQRAGRKVRRKKASIATGLVGDNAPTMYKEFERQRRAVDTSYAPADLQPLE